MTSKISQIAFVLICVMIASCAKEPPRVAGPKDEGTRTAKSIEVEQKIKAYIENTKTVRGLAWMKLDSGEEERETETAILIERPDRARVDAMDALADVWTSAGTDGNKVWLYVPSKGKLYSGKASKNNLRRLAKFNWEVSELISVLTGSPPLAAGYGLKQIGNAKDSHFIVDGSDIHLWIDPRTGAVTKCSKFENGAPDYEIVFSDHKKVNGVMFPYKMEAVFPSRGTNIIVRYHNVDIGKSIEGSYFLSPGGERAKKTVDLKDKE